MSPVLKLISWSHHSQDVVASDGVFLMDVCLSDIQLRRCRFSSQACSCLVLKIIGCGLLRHQTVYFSRFVVQATLVFMADRLLVLDALSCPASALTLLRIFPRLCFPWALVHSSMGLCRFSNATFYSCTGDPWNSRDYWRI